MNKIKSIRKDWDLIESLITPNTRLLDVGCGAGELIERLIKNIKTQTHGIEVNSPLVEKAIAKGFGGSIKEAEKASAKNALQSLKNKKFNSA